MCCRSCRIFGWNFRISFCSLGGEFCMASGERSMRSMIAISSSAMFNLRTTSGCLIPPAIANLIASFREPLTVAKWAVEHPIQPVFWILSLDLVLKTYFLSLSRFGFLRLDFGEVRPSMRSSMSGLYPIMRSIRFLPR